MAEIFVGSAQVLLFVDSVDYELVHDPLRQYITDYIDFEQQVGRSLSQSVTSVLHLSQAVVNNANIIYQSIQDTIVFDQSLTTSGAVFHQNVSSQLNFQGVASSTYTFHRSVSSVLSFGYRAVPFSRLEVINDILYFQHWVTTNRDTAIYHHLDLRHTVDVMHTHGASNQLTFTQSATFRIVKRVSASSFLQLRQGVRHSPIAARTPADCIGTLTESTITVGGVILRAPDFGDVDSIEHSRILRRTRGGDLEIFRDTNWPKTEKIKYTVSGLKQSEGTAFLRMLNSTVGQNITLIDYLGNSHVGIVTNPAGNLIQEGRDRQFKVDFELQVQLN